MGDLGAEIRQFLSRHGLRLSKALGQHFLTDQKILETIVETADVKPSDTIVEIGAGIGILTKELLKHAENVIAIELDRGLIPLWETYVADNELTLRQSSSRCRALDAEAGQANKRINELTIIPGNALKIPMPNTSYKVVANIPYHITSPLLRHVFLESNIHPTSMTLLIQREVAEKICDTKKAGMLTTLVGLFGKPRIVTTVPPSAFLPPPKVESAVLHVDCFEQPLADTETLKQIFKLTKVAFSQKRKMLRSTICNLDGGTEALKRTDIDSTRRPESLTVDEWIRLTSSWNKC